MSHELIIRQIFPYESRGLPQPPQYGGAPRGANNTYSNVNLEELRAWVAKDPLCQSFARQKAEELEAELTRLKVSKILAEKKGKKEIQRLRDTGGSMRTKPHNKPSKRR